MTTACIQVQNNTMRAHIQAVKGSISRTRRSQFQERHALRLWRSSASQSPTSCQSCRRRHQSPLHALRALRSRDTTTSTTPTSCNAYSFYASSACVVPAVQLQHRLNAFIRRGVGARLCSGKELTVAQVVEDADNKLFTAAILNNPDHTIHHPGL